MVLAVQQIIQSLIEIRDSNNMDGFQSLVSDMRKQVAIRLEYLGHQYLTRKLSDDVKNCIRLFDANSDNQAKSQAISTLLDDFNEINLQKASHMRIDLGWHITWMKQGGYQVNESGHCCGMSNMALLAFLAGDMNRLFYQPLITLYKHLSDADFSYTSLMNKLKQLQEIITQLRKVENAKEADTISQQLSEIVNILALADGIALFQTPRNYPQLFDTDITKQDSHKVRPIIHPESLEIVNKKPACVKSFTGAYDIKEFIQYLDLLKKYLGAYSFGLILYSGNHQINVNFDHKTKRWLLIENFFPAEEYQQSSVLAETLLEFFYLTKAGGIVLGTEIFTMTAHQSDIKKFFFDLQQDESWEKLHEISSEKVNRIYPDDLGRKQHNQIYWATYFDDFQWVKKAAEYIHDKQLILNMAVNGGCLNVANILIEMDEHHALQTNLDFLRKACYHQHLPLIKNLISRNIQPTEKMLLDACNNSHIEVVRYLSEIMDGAIVKSILNNFLERSQNQEIVQILSDLSDDQHRFKI